jgi:hypothetical protein
VLLQHGGIENNAYKKREAGFKLQWYALRAEYGQKSYKGDRARKYQ